MSKKDTELMAEMSECPKCGEPIALYWSPCYDNQCCGIEDRISCEVCDWEKEGYFQELDTEEFKELVPRKIDLDKKEFQRLHKELQEKREAYRRSDLSIPDLKWKIKILNDRIAQLQSEIRIFEERFGKL